MSTDPGYPWQEPSYIIEDKEEVKKLYEGPNIARELDGESGLANTLRLLGNPYVEGFKDANIVPLDVPGFGPNKDRTVKVEIHRKLAPLFLEAFERIKAEKIPYVLHTIYGYYFRYQLNDDVKNALIHLPEYADLKDKPGFAGSWNVLCAERDRANNAFDQLVDYKGSGKREKKRLLSNHSYGSAIDINAGRNDYSPKAQFDMPKRIVKIFEGLGFYWGGFYHDYMHFEYERSTIVGVPDEAPPLVLYPFSTAVRRESPLKYYFLNEGGKGGFFPLGKQQNLHAGVHVEPDVGGPLVPVKASLPGYIVAARLMTPGREGDHPFLLDATEGRHLGFVLVRHELTEPAGAESTKVYPLYSLYMHLAPPSWGDSEADKAFEKSPWLASFLKMQHGAVVNLDPRSTDFGKTYWAQEPLEGTAEAFKVRDLPQPLAVTKGGKAVGLKKASPADVREAIEALKKGSIVTFDRALFPVAAGDPIGFVAPGRPVPGPPGAPPGNASTGLPRYLHWELFSPAGDGGGLQFLAGKDEDLKKLLLELKEKQDKEDNFLRMPSDPVPEEAANDIQDLLGSTGVELVSELNNAYYGLKVQSYFNDGTKFFSAQGAREKPFTWPLPLTLENKYKFSGEPGKATTLEVLYKKGGLPLSKETHTLSPRKDTATLSVTLNVPAAADSLSLWSPVFFTDMVEVPANVLREKRIQSRKELLKKAVKHRWRNLVLNHVNEWTPAGLDKQLAARNKAGFFEHLEDDHQTKYEDLKTLLMPLCWWDRPATPQDPFGEVPLAADAQGQKNSLFGESATQLPKAANVVNMHPVTALWFLDVLLETEVIGLKKEWAPVSLRRSESTEKPPFLGLLCKEVSVFAGTELMAVLVQHGYGTTEGTTPEDVTFWLKGGTNPEPQVLKHARYQEGVALARVIAPAWGRWEFYATRADGQRFEPEQSVGTSFEVPKPRLSEQPFELGSKVGKLRPLATGSLVARENLPVALAGYVAFEYWKVPPKQQPDLTIPPTPASLTMPAIARRPDPERTAGGLKYKDDLIVGVEKKGTNPKVTPNFSFQEFVKRPNQQPVFIGDVNKFKLAFPLAQRLQELRDLCKPKGANAKDLPLTVKELDREGVSLLVGPASGRAEDLRLLVEKLPLLKPSELHTAEAEEAQTAVRLTYNPPLSSGVLNLEFDPAPALGRLAAEALSGEVAGETLHVRPRFIVPATGHALHESRTLTAVEGVANLFAASAAQLTAACQGEFLEVVADRCLPPVARFEFGDIEVKMGAGVLRTEVKLHGDANPWKAAAPVIKLAGVIQNKRGTGTLFGEWPLLDRQGQRIPQMWGGELEFSAEITQPDKVLTPPPPVKHPAFKVEPRLEKLTWAIQGKTLVLTGKGHFIPTDADFRIVCEQQDASTGEWKEHKSITSAIRYKNGGDSPWGTCSETGHFEAFAPHLLLKNAGGPFRFYLRRRTNKQGNPFPLLGALIEEPPFLEVTVAELGL